MVVGMVLLVAACGEDTQFRGQSLDDLCRSLEATYMDTAAPDRQARADLVLRALSQSDEWRELSVDERRQVEDVYERALAGDC